ncbi:MAG: hypothetical protein ACKO16_17800 [Gemmataceae bacterium]
MLILLTRFVIAGDRAWELFPFEPENVLVIPTVQVDLEGPMPQAPRVSLM